MPRAVDESAVEELLLYIDNDGGLYRRHTKPIMARLAHRMLKGTYDSKLAVKAWRYLADVGAQSYTREFDTPDHGSFGIFGVGERNAVAEELAGHFEIQVKNGEYDLPTLAKWGKGPKKTRGAEDTIVSPWRGRIPAPPKIPDRGYCICLSRANQYAACFTSLPDARRAAQELADETREDVDLIKVQQHGNERFVFEKAVPS